MKILQRFNGWQRLWLVFSVITFIATSVFILYDGGRFFMEDNFVLRGMGNPECKYVYALPKGLDPRYTNLDQFPQFECISLYEYLQSTPQPLNGTEFLRQLEQRKKEYLLSGATFYLGMWLFVVIAICVVGMTVAWVRKGFTKPKPRKGD